MPQGKHGLLTGVMETWETPPELPPHCSSRWGQGLAAPLPHCLPGGESAFGLAPQIIRPFIK